jgi:hypothetical protein
MGMSLRRKMSERPTLMNATTWTLDEIARDWLAGSVIAVPPEQMVAAFDRCERVFGREWINQSRGTSVGASPTLHVVTIGQRLASLDGVPATETLIEKLAKGDPSATAELHGIHLLRSPGQTTVELFPKVIVGDREREPDLRIRRDEGAWVYVEITQTDVSEAYERASEVLNKLSAVIESIARPFDLEVFLRREPTDVEVDSALDAVLSLCRARSSGCEELQDGLGMLFLEETPSGPVTPDDHGEEPRPRLGKARVKIEHGVQTRRVVVRLPYSDERAENLLRRESAQLPADGPGLVMVHMGNAPGGFKSWDPLIRRRFQPAIHTRVGGVCLFSAGTLLVESGIARLSQTKLLLNPHTRTALPPWIEGALVAADRSTKRLCEDDSRRGDETW